MPYRKASFLVNEVSKLLRQPVVTTEVGGGNRGGTVLTPVGEQVIAAYRAIESEALGAVSGEFEALEKLVRHG
jgi:molybdate transport system regulatory protein